MMTDAERKNIVADVLNDVSHALLADGFQYTAKTIQDRAAKLRAPDSPPPQPEPEIPYGPGDVFAMKGSGTGTQWLAVCWDGDDLCGRTTDGGPGHLYALDLSLLTRVRVAETEVGMAVELVPPCGRTTGIVAAIRDGKVPYYIVIVHDGRHEYRQRHEIRRLR